MTFYNAVDPNNNYSVTYKAAYAFKLFCYELLQTNGIKWHLACSAQSTARSLKAVKSFRINFCRKFRVLSVFLKWFLPLLFELNGPTTQHNLNDAAVVLLQRTQLILPFIVSCVWAYAGRHKIKMFVRLYRGLSGHRSISPLLSDFSHIAGSAFPLTIHATTAQRRDESKVP